MSGKIVGVLGGMGPEATVDFMAKVIALTPADKDQDHVRMFVDHNPAVPNRQAAILDGGTDPGPELAAMAVRLQQAGADFLVIPCNTAQVFAANIVAAVTIPLISIVEATVAALPEDCARAGLLATNGCLTTGIYQRALAVRNIEAVLPDTSEMAEFMALVNGIKGGVLGDEVAARMAQLAGALTARGAQAIIAGCTEVPLVLDASMLEVALISSTDVLAQVTVRYARGEWPLPEPE